MSTPPSRCARRKRARPGTATSATILGAGECPAWCGAWPICRVGRSIGTPVVNPERAAAIAEPGVVFVSAGAGTGKTTVLVERVALAVLERGSRSTRSS